MCTRAQRIRKGVRSRVTITLFLVVLQPLRSPMLNPNQLQPLKRALMMRIEVRSLSQLSERQAQCICLRRYMNVPAIQPARAAHRRLFLCMDPSFDCSVSMRSKISSSFTINLDILPTSVLAHHLLSGAKENVVEAAREYVCDACVETSKFRHQRPAKLHEPREFNELLGIDGFYWTGRGGFQVMIFHCINEASLFHLGRRIENRHFASVWRHVAIMGWSTDSHLL